jgi:hypothetical protein
MAAAPVVVRVAPLSRAMFHCLLRRLAEARHATGSAHTRRTLAQQPDGPVGAVFRVRPGELMQIDSTHLDVAVVLADGWSVGSSSQRW